MDGCDEKYRPLRPLKLLPRSRRSHAALPADLKWCVPLGQRLENSHFRVHIPGMSTIVQCNCGAEYRRTEEKFLVPHTGDAICAVCGAALESWHESTHVPSYELVERPDRKPE